MRCAGPKIQFTLPCPQPSRSTASPSVRLLAGLLGVLALSGLAGCSDDGSRSSSDGGSSSGLWPCTDPGKTCNAHDPCAINPICGEDLLCRPTKHQNCDDGLPCTHDTCGGQGECINEPENACALLIKDPEGGPSTLKCFAAGQRKPDDPCRVCDPEKDPRAWSRGSGGTCDDDNPCTIKDTCNDGTCEGEYYGNYCSDNLGCTDDVCDGKGGCSNVLKSDHCLINNVCVKDQQTDPRGCTICDASADPHSWTALPNRCQIDGYCYAPGETDVTGCGVCDPDADPSAWSAATDRCLIGGICYDAGETDATGCATCDPAVNSSAWTPAAGKCVIDGACLPGGAPSPSGCASCNPTVSPTRWTTVAGSTAAHSATFEGGLSGYTVDPPVQGVGWTATTRRAKSGSGSLYFGDPAAGTFDAGQRVQGAAVSPAVTLPAGQRAALQLWVYMDAESLADHDVLSIEVNGTPVWIKSEATLPPSRYRTWIFLDVDLSAYAGQSVTVSFVFDSMDDWANRGEGVFIDDVALVTQCGAL